MFVHRNSIIVALCLSFPSVSNAFCIEMQDCVEGFSPKKASCNSGGREFFACCSEDQETPEMPTAVCSWYDPAAADPAAADPAADPDSTSPVELPAPCYEIKEGARCWDPEKPIKASCNITAPYETRVHGACCKMNAEIPYTGAPYTSCTYLSSAPTVGAWTVTAIGAVATTVVAFYGI